MTVNAKLVTMKNNNFINIAKEAAWRAGEYLKEKIHSTKVVRQKRGEIDLVTDADIKAQEIIIEIIKKHYPNHQILAEESEKEGIGEYTWAIDPIDGTSAYSCGLPTYSSSIALLKDREPIVGAVYLALKDEVIFAEKGKGGFGKRGRLRVGKKTNLKQAAVGFDPAYFNREKGMKEIAASLSDQTLILPMLWSQASALALVAYGILDGYLQCGDPHVWDVAAGKLLVEETGGIISDWKGRSLDIFAINGYIAGNSSIYKQLLEFIVKFSS